MNYSLTDRLTFQKHAYPKNLTRNNNYDNQNYQNRSHNNITPTTYRYLKNEYERVIRPPFLTTERRFLWYSKQNCNNLKEINGKNKRYSNDVNYFHTSRTPNKSLKEQFNNNDDDNNNNNNYKNLKNLKLNLTFAHNYYMNSNSNTQRVIEPSKDKIIYTDKKTKRSSSTRSIFNNSVKNSDDFNDNKNKNIPGLFPFQYDDDKNYKFRRSKSFVNLEYLKVHGNYAGCYNKRGDLLDKLYNSDLYYPNPSILSNIIKFGCQNYGNNTVRYNNYKNSKYYNNNCNYYPFKNRNKNNKNNVYYFEFSDSNQ